MVDEATGTEQIIDAASLAKGLDDETPVVEIPGAEEKPGSTEKAFLPNKYWDDVSAKYGTEEAPFELPEAIKTGKLEEGKTEFDYFLEEVGKKTPASEDAAPEVTDPLMLDYMSAKGTEGFNEIEWLKAKTQQVDVLGLPSNKFIEFYLTQTNGVTEENPDGYSKEDIASYIGGKNKIDLDREALQYKQNYAKYLEDYREKQVTANQGKSQEEFIKTEKANAQVVSDYLTKNKTDRSFYGVELSESEYVQFEKDALDLIKRDPKTGMSKLTERLQSDEYVLKILPLLLLGEDQFKAKISGIKEGLKKSIEDNLGTGSRPVGGQEARPDQFDANALT